MNIRLIQERPGELGYSGEVRERYLGILDKPEVRLIACNAIKRVRTEQVGIWDIKCTRG